MRTRAKGQTAGSGYALAAAKKAAKTNGTYQEEGIKLKDIEGGKQPLTERNIQ